MKSPETIIILVGIILALAFGLWGTCAAKKADAEKAAAVAQAQAAEASAVHWKAYGDSADSRADSAVMGWGMDQVRFSLDSARMAQDYAAKDTAVNKEKAVFGALSAIHAAAKERKDTVAQLVTCDSAFAELRKAKIAVTDLQTSCETISTAYGNEINLRDSTIGVLATSNLQLRTVKDSLAAIAIDQTRRNIKLASQPTKRWGIGIGAGYVVGPKGTGPGVAITIHYDLIHL